MGGKEMAIEMKQQRGLTLVHTGDGKGKTTAEGIEF
jgi:ATP:corrinoid adenosyltransferase